MSTSVWIRAARPALLPLALVSERLGNRFYAGLAVAVLAAFLYAIAAGLTGGMKHQAYDLIMKSRYSTPAPDPDIVLVDIDEASLASMAPEYGRWPWPRSVMAELVEGLAGRNPRAIVFDITFSDPDIYHADADRYFRDVIRRHRDTFFPMIRLNPANDELSELRLGTLAGVRRSAPDASEDATVAMVVPYFYDTLADARLGTNNLYVDEDGIARRYHVFRDVQGWRVGSLPANVVAALGNSPPVQSDVLLNWRGRPLAYRTVSFYPLFTSLLEERSGRPADEFAGKIVIIGSTAPSLFDLKPTPVAQNHPGVDILATALDNLKNGDFLRELPRWVYMLVTVATIGLLTAAFVYNVDYRLINSVFTLVQTAFLVVTYLFLNYTTLFVDLTAPFTAALAYFFVARAYSLVLTWRRNGHPVFSRILDDGSECEALLLYCRLSATDKKERRRLGGLLQRHAGRTRYGVAAPRLFKPSPLLYFIYRDTLLFYWLATPGRRCAAMRDLIDMLERSMMAIRAHGPDAPPALDMVLHRARFTVDSAGAWRGLGKQALIETLTAPRAAGEAGIRISASPAFAALCRECAGGALPAVMREAGLRCDGPAGRVQ